MNCSGNIVGSSVIYDSDIGIVDIGIEDHSLQNIDLKIDIVAKEIDTREKIIELLDKEIIEIKNVLSEVMGIQFVKR
jgi:hypothetical protein